MYKNSLTRTSTDEKNKNTISYNNLFSAFDSDEEDHHSEEKRF
jgi:hypothetical protein